MLRVPDAWVWDFWLAVDGENYHLFFLYASRAFHDPDARHHRASIGACVSSEPILSADSRWYETLSDGKWHDEAFRDPWVLPDPDGNGWHMLITARANHGPADDRGVVGHAWSADLRHWKLRPPLSEPGQVTDDSLYSGRFVRRHDTGNWAFLALHRSAPDGSFIGEISDPHKVSWEGDQIVLRGGVEVSSCH